MPKTPRVGEPAPEFTLPGIDASGRRDFSLREERGHAVVLAFYPGDDTMMCTRQLCSYQDELGVFRDLDAVVWGISPQDVESHERFAARRGLTFPLLADVDRAVAGRYGVATPLLIRRSVFVVDGTGVLRWSHVSTLGMTYQTTGRIARVLREIAAGVN